MSNARTMKRFGWLLISVVATSGCVLSDYDLGRGPRAGSAGVSGSAGGSLARASGGSTSNKGGTTGTAFGEMASTGGVTSPQTGTSFSNAGQPAQGGTSQGGTSANSLVAPVGGALSTGGSSGTLSSAITAGGAVGTSVNGTGTSSIQGGSSTSGTASGTSGGSGGTASGTSGGSGGTASGGTTSGGTGAAGAPNTGTRPCPSGRGPDMVRVPEGYCIDKTEVTEGQYTAWTSTNPEATPANQRAECAWNNNYESSYLRDVVSYPVAGVDWCDAVAFCKWANKRLCGAIGGGAANYYTGSGNENESQWYNACSAHGANVYPYGDDIQNTWCNAGKAGIATVAPVGEFDRCTSSVSGYEEIVDMSGNVAEWLDSCGGTEASDYCRLGGGSYVIGVDPDPRCALPAYEFRNNWYYNVGFRCCAD